MSNSIRQKFLNIDWILFIQVVPGRAGGGSFKRKKNYIAKKEFAYRMCARWPTIAMSKLFSWVWTKLLPLHGCDVMRFGVKCLWFDLLSSDVASCVELLRYYSVLQSTSPVLLCTTKHYASTTLYYKVLRQYYSVLQGTTPVLLCTTKYYSGTTLYYKVLRQYYKVLLQYYSVLQSTLYYKVLLQYYSVLQSTTPVLLCTTKYYASTTKNYNVLLQRTTLYYKVLLQYYSVLQSTTVPSTTTYYSVLQSTTPVLLCTTKYYSSTTKYYASTRTY